MPLLRRLSVLMLALVCLAGSAPPATAQNPFSDFFGSVFAPRRARPPEEPRPRPIHRPKPKPAATAPNPANAGAQGGDGQTAKQAPTFFIAVIGDSQANMLAQGLAEAFAGDHRVAVVNKAKEDTGLVRSDFYDWRAAARSLLDGPQHFDAAVVQIGINDNQKLRLGGEPSPDPLSKPFNEIYAKRAEELAAIFREKKVPLIWVGQPIMRSESLSNAALVFNDIDRQYAEAQGAHYVDLWEAFSDENSVYRASGPDVNGVIVRLRAADGVHFNKAGARKAAHFVEPEIRKLLEAALQPPETPAGAAPEAPATPAPPGGGNETAPPAAPEAAAPVAPPPKPIAGKIESLTESAVSPGGALAAPPAGRAQPKTLEAAPAQPGRADDFAWPPK
ncbi:DUF459 domain-containing protein [Rhodoblastus sp. 17X3]|uniref:SGNH/GDSL hydrolase family protein n=1 Tax=Rhodoblastus sp. 17X3 TaxID=3047026 RepID=UPI0024B7C615|nr:DUF459 domain-containing protein [Rhodoblastus sp. 17X3]MDI9846504.1 DUF459 domain-containing protein [Rhodoblastus sp. 17X3]